MANLMDDLWLKVRTITGACASNVKLEQMADYLKKGEQLATAASLTNVGDAVPQLEQGAKALGQVRKTIETTQGICMDVQAVAKIHDAIKVLNDPQNMQPGSQAAARAFGDLFVGAGRFAAKLPPPANVYAPILQNAGSFFVDMQRLLNPETRPGGGRALREVMAGFERGDY